MTMKPPQSRSSSFEKDPLTNKNNELRYRTWGRYSGSQKYYLHLFLSLIDNLSQATEWGRTEPRAISEYFYHGDMPGLQHHYSTTRIAFPRKHPGHWHFRLLRKDWGSYSYMDMGRSFSWSHSGFLILDLLFFTSQTIFYFFTELHNKNRYEQINLRNESYISHNIHGTYSTRNTSQLLHLLDYINVNIDTCAINICQDCGKLGNLKLS